MVLSERRRRGKKMAKKRKSEGGGLDEAERTMYTSFCNAANSLSQLYTQAQHQQTFAFQAGERHALEKIYQWILRQQESDSRATVAALFSCLQSELGHGGDEVSMAPGLHQSPDQQNNQFLVPSSLTSSGEHYPIITDEGPRLGHSQQSKSNVFSNALPSPVRRGLQPFHAAPEDGYASGANGERRFGFGVDPDHGDFHGGTVSAIVQHAELNGVTYVPCQVGLPARLHGPLPEQNRDANSYSENDSSMDMHADSPSHGFYQ